MTENSKPTGIFCCRWYLSECRVRDAQPKQPQDASYFPGVTHSNPTFPAAGEPLG
ncbi:MAG: hypothetical protein MUC60_17800 [Oscillatoria sp. Prado101]|nr:hypothetical protein [Oscillatoria sp. Prado101]